MKCDYKSDNTKSKLKLGRGGKYFQWNKFSRYIHIVSLYRKSLLKSSDLIL